MATGLDTEARAARPGSRRARHWFSAALVLVLAAGALVVWWERSAPPRGAIVHAPMVGRRAPDFDVAALSGRRLRLADFSGRVRVLNFWASWCIPCRAEAPLLRTTAQTWRTRDVEVLGVAINDTVAAARAFRREFRLTYPQGIDPDGTLAARYGLTGVPATFVIDADGVIRGVVLGQLHKGMVDDALRAVLRGAKVGRYPGGPLRPAG